MPQLTNEFIGKLVIREKRFRYTTAAHRVESIIDNRVITRCGREMPQKSYDGELKFYDELDFSVVNACNGGCK